MNQEKFVSNYIELLTMTMTEAIQKNVVLQAQKRVLEEENKSIEHKDDLISSLKSEYEKQINDLKVQLNDSRRQREIALEENTDLKKSSLHIDTFKNELRRSRDEIERLNAILLEKNALIDKLNSNVNKKEEEQDVAKATKNVASEKLQKQKNKVKNLFVEEEQLVLPSVKDAGNF